MSTFKDQNKIADYAASAVQWAVENGLLKGDNSGNFNPTDPISRQDFAVVLKRYHDKFVVSKTPTTPTTPTEPEKPPVTPPITQPPEKKSKTKEELAKLVQDATVYIDTPASGAGVVIPGGFILTAAHVGRDLKEIPIITKNRSKYTATLVAEGPTAPIAGKEIDIKVYKVEGSMSGVVPVTISVEGIKHDEFVITYHPAYTGTGTVKSGVVCQEKTLSEEWEFDSTIPASAGNSGGAVINQYGYLVGIVVERTSVGWQHGSIKESVPGCEITNLAYPLVTNWLKANKLI